MDLCPPFFGQIQDLFSVRPAEFLVLNGSVPVANDYISPQFVGERNSPHRTVKGSGSNPIFRVNHTTQSRTVNSFAGPGSGPGPFRGQFNRKLLEYFIGPFLHRFHARNKLLVSKHIKCAGVMVMFQIYFAGPGLVQDQGIWRRYGQAESRRGCARRLWRDRPAGLWTGGLWPFTLQTFGSNARPDTPPHRAAPSSATLHTAHERTSRDCDWT